MFFYINQYFITETFQAFTLQLDNFIQFCKKDILDFTSPLKSLIQFTTLQGSLFKLLCILLLLTSLLIVYSWKVYGKVITDKFVRASTLKEIEELKLSVAKLKLPKEHSPRI